jgi:hypothetical protein
MKGLKVRKQQGKGLGYEALFTEPTTEETLELMRSPEISGYRTRTITAGDYREIEIYPLYRTPKKRREAKRAVTRDAQRKLNARNSAKRVQRLLLTNFVPFVDLFLTLTYSGAIAPTMEQARRDIRNYIKAVKRWRAKNGLPPIKYLYVIQFEDEGREVRVHHHIVMSAMDRDVAEALWNRGRAKSDRLKPDDKGLAELAAYITRSKRGNKRWCASRNLKEPTVTVADHKFTHRRAELMAADCRIAAAAIFESAYPGYQFTDCAAYSGGMFPGAYIYARMQKREKQRRKGAVA